MKVDEKRGYLHNPNVSPQKTLINYKREKILTLQWRNLGGTIPTDGPKWNHQQWDKPTSYASLHDALRTTQYRCHGIPTQSAATKSSHQATSEIQTEVQGAKLSYILQKCQGYKRQSLLCSKSEEANKITAVISNSWSWITWWTRKEISFSLQRTLLGQLTIFDQGALIT